MKVNPQFRQTQVYPRRRWPTRTRTKYNKLLYLDLIKKCHLENGFSAFRSSPATGISATGSSTQRNLEDHDIICFFDSDGYKDQPMSE